MIHRFGIRLRKKSVHSIDIFSSDSSRTSWFISCSEAIVLNLGWVSTPTFTVKLNGKNLKSVIKHRIKEQRKFIRLERSVWSQEMRSKLIKLINKRAYCTGYVQFSNRSRKTSKGGKNVSDNRVLCHIFFLPHLDVICDLLLNRSAVTWNVFV